MAQGHIAPLEECLRDRHPARLQELVQEQGGVKFMNAMQKVRKSRSVPHLHKQAMESALATHMVRARTELGRWQAGLMQIQKAVDNRDAKALAAALDQHDFHGDVPEVIDARLKLEQWQQVAAEVEPVLRAALERRDLPTIRAAIRELNAHGPKDVGGVKEAQALLEKYTSKTKRLRTGLSTKNAHILESAVKSWDFDKEDPLYTAGQQMLARREQSIQALRELAAEVPPHGPRICQAAKAWEFEPGQQDYIKICEIQRRFLQEDAALQKLAQNTTSGLGRLQVALAEWSFAADLGEGPDGAGEGGGGRGLARTRAALASYRGSIKAALEARDVALLRQQWEVAGSGAAALRSRKALGDEGGEEDSKAIIKAVEQLLAQHEDAQKELHRAVDQASLLEVAQRPEIERLVELWDFSPDDAAVEEAKEWLQRNVEALQESKEQLREALARGDAEAIELALLNARGLPEDCAEVVEARKVCQEARKISVTVQWAESGKTVVEEPIDRESTVSYLKERLALIAEVPTTSQRLKLGERVLKDAGTLKSQGVNIGAILVLSRVDEDEAKDRTSNAPAPSAAAPSTQAGLGPAAGAKAEGGYSQIPAPLCGLGGAAGAEAAASADEVAGGGAGGDYDTFESPARPGNSGGETAGAAAAGAAGNESEGFESTMKSGTLGGTAGAQQDCGLGGADGGKGAQDGETPAQATAPIDNANDGAADEDFDTFEPTMDRTGIQGSFQGSPMGDKSVSCDDFETSMDGLGAASPTSAANEKYEDEFEESHG